MKLLIKGLTVSVFTFMLINCGGAPEKAGQAAAPASGFTLEEAASAAGLTGDETQVLNDAGEALYNGGTVDAYPKGDNYSVDITTDDGITKEYIVPKGTYIKVKALMDEHERNTSHGPLIDLEHSNIDRVHCDAAGCFVGYGDRDIESGVNEHGVLYSLDPNGNIVRDWQLHAEISDNNSLGGGLAQQGAGDADDAVGEGADKGSDSSSPTSKTSPP